MDLFEWYVNNESNANEKAYQKLPLPMGSLPSYDCVHNVKSNNAFLG